MIVIVPLQGSQRRWLEPWTVLGKGSCCTSLFLSGAADRENLRCGWYYNIQTQKKRDLVHEEVTNSKLMVQKTTYGASYAMANTINCRMGWHVKNFNMVWLLLFLSGERLQSLYWEPAGADYCVDQDTLSSAEQPDPKPLCSRPLPDSLAWSGCWISCGREHKRIPSLKLLCLYWKVFSFVHTPPFSPSINPSKEMF